jgi:hypothetical protein
MVHDCDLDVKKSTLQMTAQDPNVMIARVFNHLLLALKMYVSGKSFITDAKNLFENFCCMISPNTLDTNLHSVNV